MINAFIDTRNANYGVPAINHGKNTLKTLPLIPYLTQRSSILPSIHEPFTIDYPCYLKCYACKIIGRGNETVAIFHGKKQIRRMN